EFHRLPWRLVPDAREPRGAELRAANGDRDVPRCSIRARASESSAKLLASLRAVERDGKRSMLFGRHDGLIEHLDTAVGIRESVRPGCELIESALNRSIHEA